MNIFNVFRSLVFGIITFIGNLLPNADSNAVSQLNSAMGTFRSSLASASWLFPVNQLFIVLGIVIVIELSLFTWRIIKLIVGWVSLGFIRD